MGHFLLFLVHPPAPWVWGSEGRGEECCGGSARLLRFRINLSPGNSAHLLSFPSTKCCGTAEYKVSNNFTFSCWKKYNWMQGKVNTQGNQKMESLLHRHVLPFHVKTCWKYYSCIIISFLKLGTQERGAALVLHDTAAGLPGVLVTIPTAKAGPLHKSCSLFLTLCFALATSKLNTGILIYDTNSLGLIFKI